VAVTPDGTHAITVAFNGVLKVWAGIGEAIPQESESVEPDGLYTNAKVVLVGESQAGKSGLAEVLAGREWAPTESTIGAWATQLLLPATGASDGVDREVWLWDFGGQAYQQLIHQLFLKDASLAVLVFDGQRDDAVQRVWDWNRAIAPRGHDLPRLLVAARTDINAVRLSSGEVERLREVAGLVGYLETSAKTGRGVPELRASIADAIDWSAVPCRSSPAVLRRLKGAILDVKDRGDRALTTVKDLLDWLPDKIGPFSPAELNTVIDLLAGPGAVMRLGFDDQILLQPELLNTYGLAVIRTLAEDPEERGCLIEHRLLDGDLDSPRTSSTSPRRTSRSFCGFASDELSAVVLEQDLRAQAVIERETRTQTIIADVIATASRANQLARQVDRPGPGVEIIFVNDRGKPTDRHIIVHVDPDPLPQAIGVDPAGTEHPDMAVPLSCAYPGGPRRGV
jgi:small GTP-binding protein